MDFNRGTLNVLDKYSLVQGKKYLESTLYTLIKEAVFDSVNIVVLCIGTPRSVGDSLGPLVGSALCRHTSIMKNITVLGTMENPVHALNLVEVVDSIPLNSFVIAIDATVSNCCLGCVWIKDSGLRPGAGVGKNLGVVGDVSIFGVVALVKNDLDALIKMHSADESLIIELVHTIEFSVYKSIRKFLKEKELLDLAEVAITKE